MSTPFIFDPLVELSIFFKKNVEPETEFGTVITEPKNKTKTCYQHLEMRRLLIRFCISCISYQTAPGLHFCLVATHWSWIDRAMVTWGHLLLLMLASLIH